MEDTTFPKRKSLEDDPEARRELRSKMKRVFTDFAGIEAVNRDEEEARADLEKQIRSAPRSWEFLSGMAEGVNVVTRMYPLTTQDVIFRLVARLAMIVIAKLGLEAIQEAEDLESFPEELEGE